jgi:hypothetical protein
VLLQSPPHDISSHFVIGLPQVNKDHIQVFLLLPTSFHKLPNQDVVDILAPFKYSLQLKIKCINYHG